MGYIRGIDRNERQLLPESLEDYVGPENPVRVIDAFIDGLNLGELELIVKEPGSVGRDGYDPRALLKLYIYGYLNRIRSSRALERESRRNLEVIWLTGKLQPDHWTINDFRRKNSKAFKAVLREFNLLCLKLDLFGRELVAIDGAFVSGVNSKSRNFTRKKLDKLIKRIDERVAEYLKKLESTEGAKEQLGSGEEKDLSEKLKQLEEKRREYKEMLAEAEVSPSGQLSLSDPDSRMLKKGTQSTVGYNVQIAVDGKEHLIAAAEVTQDPNDFEQLEPMASASQEFLESENLKVVADGGYASGEQVERCEKKGFEVHVPERATAKSAKGVYARERFRYDEESDSYICPENQELKAHKNSVIKGVEYRVYYSVAACRDCPVRAQCTGGKYRKIQINPWHETMVEVRARVKREPEIYARRKGLVEHPFGTIKHWQGQGFFLCRGKEKVTGEFMLSCLAYNLRRVLNIKGVAELLKELGKPMRRTLIPPRAAPISLKPSFAPPTGAPLDSYSQNCWPLAMAA
jgi:transposase